MAKEDAANAWSIGTATLICYMFNQRATDALTISKTAWDDQSLRIQQSKRGRHVWVMALQEFRDRMKQMPANDAVQIIIDERTGLPYDEYSFSHRAAAIREAAAAIRKRERYRTKMRQESKRRSKAESK